MAASRIQPREGLIDSRPDGPGPDGFRRTLGRFATGVAAVTGSDRNGPAGLLINSFTSVSLNPPLVAFCVAHTSISWPRLRESSGQCICFLAADQHAQAQCLATTGDTKFHGLAWSHSASGLPVIDGALAWLECAVEAEYIAGDHVIVVARVHDHSESDETATADPLVFYRGGFGRFCTE